MTKRPGGSGWAGRRGCRVVAGWTGLLIALTARQATGQAPGVGTPTVSVRVALVAPDLSVKPVPLLRLELRAAGTTTPLQKLVTSLDGVAATSIPAGTYVILTPSPIRFGDSTYSWSELVRVESKGVSVELTNANALATRAAPPSPTLTTRDVFRRAQRSVVRVEAGLRSASGFLLGNGLIATNDYVIGGDAAAVSVYLDSATRVPAVVVGRHSSADLALARIQPTACADCPSLTLAEPGTEPLVEPGDGIVVIGYQPSTGRTLTVGVASGIRRGAILSDLDIDHSNSGGPVLNLRGEVIGIATEGEVAGSGRSGAVLVTALHTLRESVDFSATVDTAPDQLPAMPMAPVSRDLIDALADTASAKAYQKLRNLNAGKFKIALATPVSLRVLERLEDAARAADRRKRERAAGLSPEERYAEVKAVRDWRRFVGADGLPVVTAEIVPKLGESFWTSLVGALDIAANGTTSVEPTGKYRGDVRGARFYRNGVEVRPIRGGTGALERQTPDGWTELKDVADRGYWVLEPAVFRPDSTGAVPEIIVEVVDLKNPDKTSRGTLPVEVVARVWSEFARFAALQRRAPV